MRPALSAWPVEPERRCVLERCRVLESRRTARVIVSDDPLGQASSPFKLPPLPSSRGEHDDGSTASSLRRSLARSECVHDGWPSTRQKRARVLSRFADRSVRPKAPVTPCSSSPRIFTFPSPESARIDPRSQPLKGPECRNEHPGRKSHGLGGRVWSASVSPRPTCSRSIYPDRRRPIRVVLPAH